MVQLHYTPIGRASQEPARWTTPHPPGPLATLTKSIETGILLSQKYEHQMAYLYNALAA